MDLDALMNQVNARYGWNLKLKQEQAEILQSIVVDRKKTVFAVLPTGFGKSYLYLLPPLLMDEIESDVVHHHVALVISPLRSLMADQLRRCREIGIKAVVLTTSSDMTMQDKLAVEDGNLSVIFASPEILQNGNWIRAMKTYRQRICVVALDEMHCISDWGNDFREDYKKMSKLRSIFTSATLLGLSATVTAAVYADILVKLKLETTDVCLKAVLPDRPKIFLEVKRQKTFDTDADLDWIIDGIVNERQYFDKTVIFVQTIEMVGNIFMMLISRLGKNAYVGSVNDPERRLVSMFHGQIGETLTAYTLSEFPKPDSNIRVLVSTIAFGLGVEIPDIRTVVHWGRCKNVSALWQEFGRGGRDGEPSRAIWYPTSVAGEDQALFTKLKADRTTCIRETILSAFVLPGMRTISVMPTCDSRIRCVDCHCPSCSCCSNCRSRCKCHTVNQAEL